MSTTATNNNESGPSAITAASVKTMETWAKRQLTLKLMHKYHPTLYNSRVQVAFHEDLSNVREDLKEWVLLHGKLDALVNKNLNAVLNNKIILYSGDIALVEADAIVNAGNAAMELGSGVCGAIHLRAGPKLAEACQDALHQLQIKQINVGQVVTTQGFNLASKHVLHTAGPIVKNDEVTEQVCTDLENCYINCLEEVKKLKLRSIVRL